MGLGHCGYGVFLRIGWMIGGAQGLGVDTAANIFGSGVARAGYYIYGSREYFSNIKGRHSYFNLAISDREPRSVGSMVEILATFDIESIFQHFNEVSGIMIYGKGTEGVDIASVHSMETEIIREKAAILEKGGYETTVAGVLKYLQERKARALAVDYDTLMRGVINASGQAPAIAERARNMICASASFALLGLEKRLLLDALRPFAKNAMFLKLNTLAIDAGYSLAQNSYKLKVLPTKGSRIQVDGNTLSAMGKMAGGLRFQSYYPITPASDESTFIEANQVVETTDGKDGGIVVLQTEDELAAINAASGAALTGARAATATSGPGFSLMNEGISWAGMNEVPVVITYYMRGSPATGLPTRSGQSDLKLALNAGHGEFPRIVIASGDHREVFSDAVWAMSLAERYQTPTIHIIEKTLANSYSILDRGSINAAVAAIDRGAIAAPSGTEGADYKRFLFTDTGISPRAFLGQASMYYTGDEHNEYGHITEASANRIAMYEKRMGKLSLADREIGADRKLNVVGSGNNVLLTWGSPKGAILDSMEELTNSGMDVQLVQVRLFSPYPTAMLSRLLNGKRIIAVENNYNAQGAEVLAEKTSMMPDARILKWNGRPITKDEIIDSVTRVVRKNEKRVVLNAGD